MENKHLNLFRSTAQTVFATVPRVSHPRQPPLAPSARVPLNLRPRDPVGTSPRLLHIDGPQNKAHLHGQTKPTHDVMRQQRVCCCVCVLCVCVRLRLSRSLQTPCSKASQQRPEPESSAASLAARPVLRRGNCALQVKQPIGHGTNC